MAEDLSPRLGCYGDSLARTPVIDALAREGIRYKHFYSATPVCSPNRHAIITGLYPVSTGAQHMRNHRRTSALAAITDSALLAIPTYEAVPPPEVRGFTEYLRMEGWYCTNNAKEDYQFKAPPTLWDESGGNAHWRNRPDPQQPFFAVFNFNITHESQVWKQADQPLTTDPTTLTLPPYYVDTDSVRRDLAIHYDNIARLDAQIGEKIEELRADGLLDNTIIFFYSDHGDGLPRAKRWLYDSGLRSPLIIRWPDGRGAGTTDEELRSFVDLPPTVLSLAGLTPPDYMVGEAWSDQPGESVDREYVFAGKDRMDPALDNARSARDGRYKYILNLHPDRPFVHFLPYRDQMPLMREMQRAHAAGTMDSIQGLWFRQEKPAEELYDTANDPHEVHNLADRPDQQVRLARMRQAVVDWRADVKDFGTIDENELKCLLYGTPDCSQPTTPRPEVLRQGELVSLDTPIPGASVGYRFHRSDPWKIYVEPIPVKPGDTLYTVAHRIGYLRSDLGTLIISP